MEGMGRTLDPHFDMIALGQDLVKELVKNQYSLPRLTKDFLWVAKDVSQLLQTLPRQIRWMFRKLNDNDYALEIKSADLRRIAREVDEHGRRSSVATLAAGAIIGGALSLQYAAGEQWGGYPVVSVVCFAVAAALIVRLFFRGFR
jgi:ubiquinone biosynthesis protein